MVLWRAALRPTIMGCMGRDREGIHARSSTGSNLLHDRSIQKCDDEDDAQMVHKCIL